MRDFPYMHLDKTGLAQSKSTKRVCRFIPGFRYVLVLWFIALLILSNVILPFHRNTAYADSRWDNVKEWKGTISLTGVYQGKGTTDNDEVTVQNSMSGSVSLSEELNTTWSGYVIGSMSIYVKEVSSDGVACDDDGIANDDVITTVEGGGSITNDKSINLTIDEQTGVYGLGFEDYVDVKTTVESCTTGYTTGQDGLRTYEYLHNIPLPESGLTLSGNKKYTDDYSWLVEGMGVLVDYEVTWNLEPVTAACVVEKIKLSPTRLTLKKNMSDEVTVTVTGKDGCPAEGETVKASVSTGKSRISVSPASQETDENGQAVFTVIAGMKTGKAMITFKAGGKKKSMVVRVKK